MTALSRSPSPPPGRGIKGEGRAAEPRKRDECRHSLSTLHNTAAKPTSTARD